jgi:hypothetical protein
MKYLQDLNSDYLGPSEKLPHMDTRSASTSPELLCSPRTRASYRRPTVCQVCRATITNESQAMLHVYREHLNEPALFACRLCDFKSSCNRQYALRHAARVHKNIYAFISREEELSAKIEAIKNQCFNADCRKRLFPDEVILSDSPDKVDLNENTVKQWKSKRRINYKADHSASYSKPRKSNKKESDVPLNQPVSIVVVQV